MKNAPRTVLQSAGCQNTREMNQIPVNGVLAANSNGVLAANLNGVLSAGISVANSVRARNVDLLFLGCNPQLAQSPGFELSDSLLGDTHLGADLFERLRLVAMI
jgi:hypothetical protein